MGKVANEFDPQNALYREALAMIAIPAIACSVLTLAIAFCRRCFVCCGVLENSKYGEKAKKLPKFYVLTFVVAAVVVVGGNVYGYLANDQISDGVQDIETSVERMEKLKDDSLMDLDDVSNRLDQVVTSAHQADEVLTNMTATTTLPPELDDIVVDAKAAMQSIETEVPPMTRDIRDQTQNIRSETDLDEVTDMIHKFDRYRWRAQIAVFAFLSLPFIMTFSGFACKLKGCITPVVGVGYFTAFIGWLICAVETSAVVGLGDLCVDPNAYLTQRVDGVEVGSTEWEYVQYYVVCEDIANPSQDIVDKADEAIATSNLHIQTFGSELNKIDRPEFIPAFVSRSDFDTLQSLFYDLGNSTQDVDARVDQLENGVLKCNTAHNMYVDAMTGLCHDTLDGLFSLVLIQGVMASLTLVAIKCASALKAYWQRPGYGKKHVFGNSVNERMSYMFEADTGGGGDVDGTTGNDVKPEDYALTPA